MDVAISVLVTLILFDVDIQLIGNGFLSHLQKATPLADDERLTRQKAFHRVSPAHKESSFGRQTVSRTLLPALNVTFFLGPAINFSPVLGLRDM